MTAAAAAVAGLWLAAAPAPAPELVLDCYVSQSSQLGLGQFVRHLRIEPARRVVHIADGVGGGGPRFVGNGALVSLDGDRVVFDFASTQSAGRTTIDRRTGAFLYADGRATIRGTCQEGGI